MNPTIHDFFLENHVLRRLEIESPSACEVNCFMDADCVSYNLRRPQDPDRGYLCELSDSTDKIHPLDVKYETGALYKSFQVGWYHFFGHYKFVHMPVLRVQQPCYMVKPTLPWNVMSYHLKPCPAILFQVLHVISWHVVSFRVTSCHDMKRIPCRVTSFNFWSCHFYSCHFHSC